MKLLVIAMLSILMIGCAAPTIMIDVPNLDSSSSLSIEDLRPESEKKDEIFSLFITSEAYGTYRRGDKLVNPNPIRLLQHKIHEKYSDSSELPEVKVHHLVVYMNLKSELRSNVMGSLLGGAIGSAIASSTQKYGIDGLAKLTSEEEFNKFDEEYKRALYTKEENPEKVSVYKVYLEAEINGKRTFVMTMTPARLPKDSNREPHVAALETAMAYFLDQYL
jgi:hypothetical protein